MYSKADIGVIGGSGFYAFANSENSRKLTIDTPYGETSEMVSIIKIGKKKVAFIPRHGKDHTIPPAAINYRANIYAMKKLGVKCIISTCAVGSLKEEIEPGSFVICDQFVDRTCGRKDTFYDEGPEVKHISSADPYDQELRVLAISTARALGIDVHSKGTIVVINGPRFSTREESKWYKMMGWDIINMTQYPEGYLCLEKDIPVVNISLVTDYDAGIEGRPEVTPANEEDIQKVLQENVEKLHGLLEGMIENIDLMIDFEEI
jgi:5'-methylthioadenosine phosphorylase